MKKKNIIKIIVSFIVIGLIAYTAIFGIQIGGKTIIKGVKKMNTGLDISGGVNIVYQAKVENGKVISADDLKKAEAVIKKRLEKKNIYDYVVRSDVSKSQISVDIPADINDTSKDPLKAVEGLDKTAKVTFKDPSQNVLLSGDDIKDAKYSEEAVESTGLPAPHVVLEFSENGAKKFTTATGNLIGKAITIYLDENEITSPTVNSKITSNTAIITMGKGTYAEKKSEAEEYSMLISSGVLPFSLDVISKEYIGPYIGQQALTISAEAGIVALFLICLVMICVYKLPGLVASFSLIAYISLHILLIDNAGISMTLSSIAGLILSIGMAVDANVIIFERLKEELKENQSVKAAFERSFKNAMTAIVDGNVSIVIVALVLYILGSGPIKGFGLVLALGVMISLFTAVVLTKYILKEFLSVSNKNAFLFGIKKEVK